MKSSVNKGFFTYLILFIFMGLGVVLISAFIMMFSPNTSILGYKYLNDNSLVKLNTYESSDTITRSGSKVVVLDSQGNEKQPLENGATINFASLEKLVIKTSAMTVNVIYSGEEDRIDVKR